MKDLFTDANFPKTPDGRVYHLGLREGEVANRILTVGSPSRAESIAKLLDGGIEEAFRLSSDRAFLTYTGLFNGVPISIVSIGMGFPNMDFFVREVRECVSGDLVIIRLGSCGGLIGLPVGSLVVPSSSIAITRNYDFDFGAAPSTGDVTFGPSPPYFLSRPVKADPELHAALTKSLKASISERLDINIHSDSINASADSFYSSQGRQTSFPDHNEGLIDYLVNQVPGLASLEMESFHLFHLAHVWRPHLKLTTGKGLPPTNLPVEPLIVPAPSQQTLDAAPTIKSDSGSPRQPPRIRAAAVQMIFACRRTQSFIEPEQVAELEAWSGLAVLQALSGFKIPPENLHKEAGSVWGKHE